MWTRFAVSFEWQSCSPFVSPIFPPDANHAPAPRSWRDSGYPAFAQWVIGRSTRLIRTTPPGVGRGGRGDDDYLEISQLANAFCNSATPASVISVPRRAHICRLVTPK